MRLRPFRFQGARTCALCYHLPMPRHVYVHIPFCVRKCSYCDFSSVFYSAPLARRYVDALRREIQLRGIADPVETLYIGGGTPTTLGPEGLRLIMGCLADHFNIKADAEITVEANPGTIGEELAAEFSALGVTRASIGVQSMNASELSALGRIHSPDEAMRAALLLRPHVRDLCLDLIYGIPGQSIESWKRSLADALGLGPAHISAYELTLEPGTQMEEEVHSGRVALPTDDEVAEMYMEAEEFLGARGYEHYEVSNYALPGHRSRHNENYWARGEYIGLGAAAHSFLCGSRMENEPDPERYIEAVESGRSPALHTTAISSGDAAMEYVFLGMRRVEGLDMDEAHRILGLRVEDAASELISDGFIVMDKSRIRLTRNGMMLYNSVLVSLLQRLGL